jgi:hypothetical protein
MTSVHLRSSVVLLGFCVAMSLAIEPEVRAFPLPRTSLRRWLQTTTGMRRERSSEAR